MAYLKQRVSFYINGKRSDLPYYFKIERAPGRGWTAKTTKDQYESVEETPYPDEGKVEVRGHLPGHGDEVHKLDHPDDVLYVVNTVSNKTAMVIRPPRKQTRKED